MKSNIKNLFLIALRSNNYLQTFDSGLRCDQRYSALGVLCQLHSVATNTPWSEIGTLHTKDIYLGQSYDLPNEVAEWAGLDENEIDDLALWNDNYEMTFDQIADGVEADFTDPEIKSFCPHCNQLMP